METPVWPLFAFFATFPFAVAGCGICWYQALRRRTPRGVGEGSSVAAWRASLWAPPDHFTTAGNWFRVAAIACMLSPQVAWGVSLMLLSS